MAAQKTPAAKAAMLIRKPVQEVFEAMVNPDITSQFWTGTLTCWFPGTDNLRIKITSPSALTDS